jgi:phosphate transport system protein
VGREDPDRHRRELRAVQESTLAALDLVATQLSRALDALASRDCRLAAVVIAGDARIDAGCLELHRAAIALLGREASAAGDLDLVGASLQMIRCIELIGDQCVNIARLVPVPSAESRTDSVIAETIDQMGRFALAQTIQVSETLRTRRVPLALGVSRRDQPINRLTRQILRRAATIGDEPEVREWTVLMILVARSLERIGDSTVEIAEQLALMGTGAFATGGP